LQLFFAIKTYGLVVVGNNGVSVKYEHYYG